jgi:FkbM family methyltransferase
LRILWHSVAPWAPTGYGTQTGIMAPRLRDMGHDIALSVYYGLQGAQMQWDGMTCYPSYSAPYGADVIVPHALHHFQAERCRSIEEASTKGIILTLGDVWTFESPLLDQLCVGAWAPVDHLQVPQVTAGWLNVMGAIPIAMSRFGVSVLRDAGFQPLYAPHGVDTSVFRPGDKTAARAAAGLPEDAFVVAMVANNVGRDGNRKAFSEQIAAFGQLRARHTDAHFVLHTDVDQPQGMRLRSFLEDHLPQGSYTYTDIYTYRKGLNPAAVADIYRAADVLSNCSYGEGFGIPIVEAQACGTPVIVTDATAMPELCGSGWKVGWQQMWHDSQGAWAAVPNIGEIADAYEQAYEKARDETMRAEAYAFAQDYDADAVAEKYWRPIMATFESLLERKRAELAEKAGKPRRLPEKIREADSLMWIDRGMRTGDVLGWANHEENLRNVLPPLLPVGGVLLDVGAHVGHWSLRLAEKASLVVAVEANPDTAKTLWRHIAMNGIGNVQVAPVAAWDQATVLKLDDPSGQIEGGSMRVVDEGSGIGDGYVPANRLDDEVRVVNPIRDAGRLDVVKLDVEGADLHALRGMKGLLDEFRPVLFIECHDIYGYYTRGELEQTLTDLGYEWEVAATVPTKWMPDGISDTIRMADYLIARPIT